MLGKPYPGFFEVGDCDNLARLMTQAEVDPLFYRQLKDSCRQLKPRFLPSNEKRLINELVCSLVWYDGGTVGKQSSNEFADFNLSAHPVETYRVT